MSFSVGPASIVLVEHSHRSMKAEAFKTRLDLVKAVINNGALSYDPFSEKPRCSGYGSDDHKAALDEVEKQIQATRQRIAEIERVEAAFSNNGDDDE